MFTAAILPAVAESGEMLRPLEWGELSARFDAVRDVRGLMARPQGGGSSFGAHALAGLPHEFQEARGLGEPCVNLDGIGTVNRYETIDVATSHDVATGDQGTR
jgi:hypothetical protein